MSSKFNQMFNFISQYKFEINKNLPDNLKCGKCRNILINAYCLPCGCSYCFECMNEMLNDGVEKCPGETEDCKDELISNNHLDCKANKAISNFVIKCPEEMCLHECAIINMEEHLRVCEKKKIKCPFADLGCDGQSSREIINDHCQAANFNHSKILIEMIDNIRNEIGISEKINDEIQLIQKANETVNKDCDLFKKDLLGKIEEINEKVQRANENMKIEFNRKLDEINENFEKKMREIFVEVQKKSELIEINELNKVIDKIRFPIFEWKIDKLNEKKKKDECIFSDYFNPNINKQYTLQLSFWANGRNDIYGKGCSIYLWIYPGSNDQFLSWPFSADVTIKITSKTNPKINQNITKYCKIDKPINTHNSSESFNYSYSDLTTNGEELDNCFIIECFVDLK